MFCVVMNRNCFKWLLLWAMLAAITLSAQPVDIHFEYFSKDNGLPGRDIVKILQDRKGFIWLGASQGLLRYDGYQFNDFINDPADTSSLGGNSVNALCEDQHGNIWVGTNEGFLNCFDPKAETFVRYHHDPLDSASLSPGAIQTIFEDGSGTIWIGTFGGGLNRLIPGTPEGIPVTFKQYRHDSADPETISNDRVFALLEDRENRLWVATFGGGLNLLHREKETFEHFPRQGNRFIFSLIEDHTGLLLTGTATGGIHAFDPGKNEFVANYQHNPKDDNSLPANRVLALAEDERDALWIICYDKGLTRLDSQRKHFTHYHHHPNIPFGLRNHHLYGTIYKDRQGALWVGGEGVHKFEPTKYMPRHFHTDPANPNSVLKSSTVLLAEDHSGGIWIGADKGKIYRFDRQTGVIEDKTPQRANSKNPVHQWVSVIYEDRFGEIWMGRQGKLDRYDPKTDQYRFYQPRYYQPGKIQGMSVLSILEDSQGVLWFGTSWGLNRFDRKTDSFASFQIDTTEKMLWSVNAVWSLCEDRQGNIWIGNTNDGGVSRFNRDTETFTHYVHDEQDASSLDHDRVYVVFADQAGTIWVGTHNGLDQFDPVNNGFIHFRKNHGLGGEAVNSIQEDARGNLWLGTSKGVVKFNHQNHIFRRYDKNDGLLGNYAKVDFIKRQTGEIFVSSDKGFSSFYPDSLTNNAEPPPVVITYFERFNSGQNKGTPIIEKGITEKEHIDLSYKDNILTFEFAALNYRNSNKNQYAYKLEGFTDNWIQLSTRRLITFTHLDPGEYTFRVKGSNNDGVWNEEGTSLKITILPPWWKTGWAYALYGSLAIALLFGIRRSELNRQRLKHQAELEHLETAKLQEVDRLKSRFFANISHEFRTPLTLIRGPMRQLITGNYRGNLPEMYQMILRNTDRLLRLVNQLLDISRLEAGKMKLQAQSLDIVPLTRQLVMAFESLAGMRSIRLKYTGPAECVTAYIDREKYEKIIVNLLSNALKFTPEGGKVGVSVERGSWGKQRGGKNEKYPATGPERFANRSGFVSIRITDTGRGILPEELPHIFDRFYQAGDAYADTPGSGIGLALTKELVELHGGEIHVESEVGKGSTFTVRLPLGKAHLADDEIADIPLNPPSKGDFLNSPSKGEFLNSPSKGDLPVPPFEGGPGGMLETGSPAISKGTPTLLIVEDNPDMRQYMRGHLASSYRVMEAENGKLGLKAAQQHAPDLIISDVMMPEMDGIEFCEALKNDARISHIPVILLTARAARQHKLEGLEAGADDYLPKPFDAEELLTRIKNLIRQRQLMREKFRKTLQVSPSDVTVTSIDAELLQKAIDVVEEHMDDARLNTAILAKEIGMSRGHLNVKLSSLTGLSTRMFIRQIRLKRAAQLLSQHSGNITEVAYAVGFNSISHFAKVFKAEFGISPSAYLQKETS